MLFIQTEQNNFFQAKAVQYQKSYDDFTKKLTPEELMTFRDYIRTVINETDKFSIATHFGNPWPNELLIVYNKISDTKLAVYYLAQTIQDYLIFTGDKWITTKTDIAQRGFETNFYWRAND